MNPKEQPSEQELQKMDYDEYLDWRRSQPVPHSDEIVWDAHDRIIEILEDRED